MNKKLYVGNLSYKIDEEALKAAFAEMGEVESVKIIKDPVTGRSKGFGFVEMTTEEDAQKAISTLNGTTLMERTITVNEAKPQTDRRPRTGGGGGGGRRGFDRSGSGRKPGNWR